MLKQGIPEKSDNSSWTWVYFSCRGSVSANTLVVLYGKCPDRRGQLFRPFRDLISVSKSKHCLTLDRLTPVLPTLSIMVLQSRSMTWVGCPVGKRHVDFQMGTPPHVLFGSCNGCNDSHKCRRLISCVFIAHVSATKIAVIWGGSKYVLLATSV